MSANTPAPPSSIRLASSDFAGPDKAAALRELYGRELMRVDLWSHANAQGAFEFSTSVTLLGQGMVHARTECTPAHQSRSPALMQDGCDDIFLATSRAPLVLRTPRGEQQLPANSMVVLSKAREYEAITPCGGPTACVLLPRASIAPLVPRLEEAPLLVLPHGAPSGALALAYAQLLSDSAPLAPPQQALAVAHLRELVAGAIAPALHPHLPPAREAQAASRLALIRHDMQARLGQASLSLEEVARRHHLTPRQVQRLFAQQGSCFSDALREARLDHARALLLAPAQRQRRVLDIALDCGFADISTFNRAFRRRFGLAPSDLR